MKRRQLKDYFYEKVEFLAPHGCWIWLGATRGKGYGSIRHHGRTLSAHRLAYEWAFGMIPEGLSVLHACDNPKCVNPAHLFVGTNQDNIEDRNRKGRQASGEVNGSSKLTWDTVRHIRQLCVSGKHTHRSLAKLFGVDHRVIGKVITNQTWIVRDPTGGRTDGGDRLSPPAG